MIQIDINKLGRIVGGPSKRITGRPERRAPTKTDAVGTRPARLLDIGVVLSALGDLIPEAKRHTPIGIFGHPNGGAAAGEAMLQHREIGAGVNLDGFIPGGSFLRSGGLLTAGLDRPFGLMLSLDQRPEGLRQIEIFLSNMRAPSPGAVARHTPLRLQ